MSRFLEFGDSDGISVTLNHASHLVVRDSKELVIRYGSFLGLELVKTQCNIPVLQFLCGDGIRRVVNQYVRISAHIYQVNHFVIYRSRIIGHSVQPGSAHSSAKLLHQLARPHFGIDTFQG